MLIAFRKGWRETDDREFGHSSYFLTRTEGSCPTWSKMRKYSYKATLTDYAKAAEALARELNLPFLDLHRVSIAHHNEIGREESMTYNFKEGDKTHFNKKGAEAITDLIIEGIENRSSGTCSAI